METIFFGNTLQSYLIVIATILLGILLIRLFKRAILTWLKRVVNRTASSFDDFLLQGVSNALLPLLYFSVFYFALKSLVLPLWLDRALDIASMLVWTFLITRLVIFAIRYFLRDHLQRRGRGDASFQQVKGIALILSSLIWIIAILFFISNLGYNVATLLTGLGIGGIAIALATQNIIADLFNYFVLFFDRPFEVGDFVVVEDKSGTVESIGIKTTRIRALTGEQLVFSNTDLTNSRLHNFKRLQRRRIVFTIGVTYDTPKDKLVKIPQIIRDAITSQPDTLFDRAHFLSYGDFSLIFEVVYFVLSDDFNKYMDINQAMNLHIYEAFRNARIQFAYPTQSLIVRNPAVSNESGDDDTSR
ncbi:mechanosensitive ion channel family protein [Parapedobacter koreensis]|uniref:Small-conductance mechanosensitive channel n=1 Tax=Parapedobacter koreensis TaxID=332977 RepID=A0A1H7L5S6_9SPHI|nr:mechanosensitive ion channel family protein [Parapedobacter koreensis]SEK94160.1 Small-conductance mechanosensitive channel [Parapedobacter koreensis]